MKKFLKTIYYLFCCVLVFLKLTKLYNISWWLISLSFLLPTLISAVLVSVFLLLLFISAFVCAFVEE